MSGNVTLSSSAQSTLLTLQNTAQMLQQTQQRLATGKKVNSAIDNPTSFFSAQSLTQKAGDLSGLLDGMSQGIRSLNAANQGITLVMPPRLAGWLLHSPPPSVLKGSLPTPEIKLPSETNLPPWPRSQKPMSSICCSTVMVKLS